MCRLPVVPLQFNQCPACIHCPSSLFSVACPVPSRSDHSVLPLITVQVMKPGRDRGDVFLPARVGGPLANGTQAVHALAAGGDSACA